MIVADTTSRAPSRAVIYPLLGAAVRDLGFLRISGSGIGNSLFPYFRSLILAQQSGARLLTPAWPSFRPGLFLRKESNKRLYLGIFRSHPDEISGVRKYLLLLSAFLRRKFRRLNADGPAPTAPPHGLVLLESKRFTFNDLHDHRDLIRVRLMSIMSDPMKEAPRWGNGGFIAVHVRLGDFRAVTSVNELTDATANVRIPLSWYVQVISALQAKYPQWPVHIFSDGTDAELRELTDIGGKVIRSGSDIQDMLLMSCASLLVGSKSTFSRWAAFLGNMPSIWLKAPLNDDKPSAPEVPAWYLPLEVGSLDFI